MYVKMFEEFLNESTTDGSIENFIEVLNIAIKTKLFTEDFFLDMKDNFMLGVTGSLKLETLKLPEEHREKFARYVNELTAPMINVNNFNDLITVLKKMSAEKTAIIKKIKQPIEEKLFNKQLTLANLKDKISSRDAKEALDDATAWLTDYFSGIISDIRKSI